VKGGFDLGTFKEFWGGILERILRPLDKILRKTKEGNGE